jgi:hypothetical protein
MGCGINHPLQVYHVADSQNVRSGNEYHLGDGNVTGRLFTGCLFWFPGTSVPPNVPTTGDCFWEEVLLHGDVHDEYRGWQVGGYFNERALREFRWAAAHHQISTVCPQTLRHTQHANLAESHRSPCTNHSNPNDYSVRRMLWLTWIDQQLRAAGWNGTASQVFNGLQNFAHRPNVRDGGSLFGVRVLQTRSLMDSAGTHLLWLARNNWVWFSWGNPPVTGATRHWAIRCIAWSTSRDAGATINYGSFFVDAALDSPTGTENWTVYSIATMPTGGPV